MTSRPRHSTAWLLRAALSLGSASAFAQDAPALTAPLVQNSTDVAYPDGAHGDAVVILELAIDPNGTVSQADVLAGTAPFAQHAQRAVLGWHFTPARRGELAVAARIRARVQFHQQHPSPTLTQPTKPATAPTAVGAPLEVTVRGQRQAIGQTTLSAAEVRDMPGAFGDPFRTVEALPGVTPVLSGFPYFYVRGAPPNDNAYYIDGVRVPLLFHLGIGQGVIHPGLVDRIEFYPGAPPASYSGTVGAVIAGTTRAPSTSLRGEINLRLLDVGALLEVPIDDGHGSVLVAGRYGYPGPILSAITSELSLGYWDYQARASWRIADHDTVGLFAFGSHDYLGTLESGRMVELFSSDFHRLDLRYEHALADGYVRFAATGGYDSQGGTFDSEGPVTTIDALSGAVRLEVDSALSSVLRLRSGASARFDNYRFEQGTAPVRPSGAMQPAVPSTADPPPTNLSGGVNAEFVWQITPSVEIVPAASFDMLASSRAEPEPAETRVQTILPAFDPRLGARVLIARDVAWLSSIGLSHQYPSLRVSAIPAPLVSVPGFPFGREQLQTVLRGSQGIELTLPEAIVMTVTGFVAGWSGLSDLTANCIQIMPANMPGRSEAEGPPPPLPYHCPADEPVTGRAYGLELLVRRPLSKRLSGLLAYTLSRSTRKAHFVTAEGGDAVANVPSEFDRTHVLNAILAYDLGAGWRSGARFVFYTGTPYSELDGNLPVPPYNAQRDPPFFRLDVRLEKRWRLGNSGSIAFVLEGQNVTLSKQTSSLGTDCIGDASPDSHTTRCKRATIGPLTLPSVGVEAFF